MSKGGVHNALSRGVLPSAMSRAVGDMEGTSGLERYGETLAPCLDLWQQPEWAYLRREYLFGLEASPAAVVGEFGIYALVNPAGSGQLVVVEKVHAYAAATLAYFLGTTTEAVIVATLAAAALPVVRDTRGTTASGRARAYVGTDPAVIAPKLAEAVIGLANTTVDFRNLPIILSPGFAVFVECSAANNGFAASIGYRERTAFPGELE